MGKNKVKDWKACVRTWEKNKKTEQKITPKWFEEDNQIHTMTKEEQEELEGILNGFDNLS